MSEGVQKVSIVAPGELMARIEAERARLTRDLGARVSMNQTLISLLRRALAGQPTN